MTVYAYARVSTLDQNTQIQIDDIKRHYPNAVIREEKKSGTSLKERHMLGLLIEIIESGDKLVVWKLDRLARNLNDLTTIVSRLEAKGASLEILDQKIDTSNASGKAFLQMLGVFAEFETNLRKERQAAGIAKAKAEGKYKGRPVKYSYEDIISLKNDGKSVAQITKQLGCSRTSVYRVLNQLPDH
ncbi:recombinase family protein [Thalassotalea litorea]|uniref:recombinase family protein n=1 Tax=Thalassotalea litorea TaxID=2020715 RepID=UPI0037365564